MYLSEFNANQRYEISTDILTSFTVQALGYVYFTFTHADLVKKSKIYVRF